MNLISNAYRPLLVQMVKQFAYFALDKMLLGFKRGDKGVFFDLDLFYSLRETMFQGLKFSARCCWLPSVKEESHSRISGLVDVNLDKVT